MTAVSELIHCRRHDVHNMEALLLQILEQTGQGGDGCGMYVVDLFPPVERASWRTAIIRICK
jgi:hypothetical protein